MLAVHSLLEATHRLGVIHVFGNKVSLKQVLVRVRAIEEVHGGAVIVQVRRLNLDAVDSLSRHVPGDQHA